MNIEERDTLFEMLMEFSDEQFDPLAKNRLKDLIGKPNEEVSYKLLGIIDDCVYCSFCSSFELKAMNMIYEAIGGDQEVFAIRNKLQGAEYKKWIRDNKEKYGWITQPD
jgi:hypothetical protein